jgi:HEAT repeat protein
MNRLVLVTVMSLAAGCNGDATGQRVDQGPALPPLQLRPFLADLKALIAAMPVPPATEQRELRELGDLALQLVEADTRTAGRAERSLLEHKDAWWVLEPALAHERIEVRRRAAWLCGKSGQTVLQLPLLLRLKYELDPESVLWVADALQRLGNDTGLGWLEAAIGVEATAQQAGAMAVEALRARGVTLTEQPTWDEIRKHLRDFGATWRQRGVPSLADAKAPDQVQLDAHVATQLVTTEGTLLRPIDDAKFVLVSAGTLPVALLTRTLVAEEPYLRSTALELLARIGLPAKTATPAVLPLLGDPKTASYAVRALGECGATEAAPFLRARLVDIDTEVRLWCTQALGILRDEPSREALRARLRATDEALDVRVGAAFGLLCFGADAEAEAFLAEREQKKDYHESTLARLRERLAALPK